MRKRQAQLLLVVTDLVVTDQNSSWPLEGKKTAESEKGGREESCSGGVPAERSSELLERNLEVARDIWERFWQGQTRQVRGAGGGGAQPDSDLELGTGTPSFEEQGVRKT